MNECGANVDLKILVLLITSLGCDDLILSLYQLKIFAKSISLICIATAALISQTTDQQISDVYC